MIAVALALTLGASDGLAAYAEKACPHRAEPQERARCLERAMNAEVDHILLPLKRKKSPDFRTWMDLQAELNRWAKDLCGLQPDPEGRARCFQNVYAERGFEAKLMAGKDPRAFASHLAARREAGHQMREALFSRVQAAEQHPDQAQRMETLERIRSEPDVWAKAQCTVLAEAPTDCAQALADTLLATVELPRTGG